MPFIRLGAMSRPWVGKRRTAALRPNADARTVQSRLSMRRVPTPVLGLFGAVCFRAAKGPEQTADILWYN